MAHSHSPKPRKVSEAHQLGHIRDLHGRDDSEIFLAALLTRLVTKTRGFTRKERFIFDRSGADQVAMALTWGRSPVFLADESASLLDKLARRVGAISGNEHVEDATSALVAYDLRLSVAEHGHGGMIIRVF